MGRIADRVRAASVGANDPPYWYGEVRGRRVVLLSRDGQYIDIGSGEIYHPEHIHLDHPATEDEAARYIIGYWSER